jgi:hypothetical protein
MEGSIPDIILKIKIVHLNYYSSAMGNAVLNRAVSGNGGRSNGRRTNQ